MLSNKNDHFGFHAVALTNIPAGKAFLALSGAAAQAREFNMVSGRDHQTLNVYLDDEGTPLPDGKKETLEDGDDDTLF
jgi:hypothetical protein